MATQAALDAGTHRYLDPTRCRANLMWRDYQMRRQREMTMVRGLRLVCRYRFVPRYTGRRKPCSNPGQTCCGVCRLQMLIGLQRQARRWT